LESEADDDDARFRVIGIAMLVTARRECQSFRNMGGCGCFSRDEDGVCLCECPDCFPNAAIVPCPCSRPVTEESTNTVR